MQIDRNLRVLTEELGQQRRDMQYPEAHRRGDAQSSARFLALV